MDSDTSRYFFPLHLDPTVSPFFSTHDYKEWKIEAFNNYINSTNGKVPFTTMKNLYTDNLNKISDKVEVPREIKSEIGRLLAATTKMTSLPKTNNNQISQNNVYGTNNIVYYSSSPIPSSSTINHLTFKNTTPNQYQTNVQRKETSRKRKEYEVNDNDSIESTSSTSSAPFRQRINYTENDNVFVDNLPVSVGSFIGTLARNSNSTTYTTRYFTSCGMNGIIDLTENIAQSQMSSLPPGAKEAIIEKLSCSLTRLRVNHHIRKLESILKKHTKYSDKKYLKKCHERVRCLRTKEKGLKSQASYQHILNLHIHHKYLFKSQPTVELSEGDYIIKVWGPLFEITFRKSGIIPHWGDTQSEQNKNNGICLKIDLRLVSKTWVDDSSVDSLVAEFAGVTQTWEYFKDKLKTVLSSKIQLNHLLQDHPKLNESKIRSIIIPFVVVMKLDAEVFGLKLFANGLYGVISLMKLSIPDAEELKKGAATDLVMDLKKLMNLCKEVQKFNDDKVALLKKQRRRSLDTARGIETDPSQNGTSWTRMVVVPPKIEKDNTESSNTLN